MTPPRVTRACIDGFWTSFTTGSRGIGRAAAFKFATEGARVVIAARGADQGNRVVGEIAAVGGRACFVATDVSRSEEVNRLITTTVQTFGRVDCAFNNAASIGEPRQTVEFIPLWRLLFSSSSARMYRVNRFGRVLMAPLSRHDREHSTGVEVARDQSAHCVLDTL